MEKQQIIQRLYDSKQITFDEMLILLDKGITLTPIYPQYPIYPTYPGYPSQYPVITCDTSNLNTSSSNNIKIV